MAAVFLAALVVTGGAAYAQRSTGPTAGHPPRPVGRKASDGRLHAEDAARVASLLSRMTLQEKLGLIHDAPEDRAAYQGQAGYIAGAPRLGVRGLRLADGPPGVLTRRPSQAETATMGVAATFDVDLARENGVVIGREARALGIDVALQPYINIDRDLTFKRAYNTFGEDPLLTSAMGAAEIRGIQSQRVMAMAKHFIGFDTAATDVWIDDQTLHEVYLPPFEAAVNAGVAAVMCSYNHINGPYACGDRRMLTGILRRDLGFEGFVTSDWGATHSALFLNAGLDVEMIDGPDSAGHRTPAYLGAEAAAAPQALDPNGYGDLYGGQLPEDTAPAPDDGDDLGAKVDPVTIAEALKAGAVSEATATRAAGHVLAAMQRFGLLDGRSRRRGAPQAVAANAAIIERTAIEAAVLLKNDGAALPLKAADLGSTVLIGPTAGQLDAIGIAGERSLGLPERQVSPLAALRKLGGADGISYAVADDMTGTPIPFSLFSTSGHAGLERTSAGGRRIDAGLDFTLKGGNALAADTAAVWRGSMTVPQAGTYWLYLQALGANAALFIDRRRVAITGAYQGDVHGDVLQPNQDNIVPTTDGLDNVRRAASLTAGTHEVEVRISPDGSHAPAQIRLNWRTPADREQDHMAAVAAAARAKTAVVFAWARRAPAFKLTGDQDRLIEEVAAVNPNTIVVLNTSQPVALPWAGRVKAILQMWWPGDEGGWATAKLLLGKADPSGRLPVTWARRLEDYPATDPGHPERSGSGRGGKTVFSEGLDVGYRWFDRRGVEPLFSFGHGLSYTKFDYSQLQVMAAADGGRTVSARIRNVGRMDGDEVVQVYLGAPMQGVGDGAKFPVRKLVAFGRVRVPVGKTRTIRLPVPARQLQYWSAGEGKWITASGPRTISVGASSRDLRLERQITINPGHGPGRR